MSQYEDLKLIVEALEQSLTRLGDCSRHAEAIQAAKRMLVKAEASELATAIRRKFMEASRPL